MKDKYKIGTRVQNSSLLGGTIFDIEIMENEVKTGDWRDYYEVNPTYHIKWDDGTISETKYSPDLEDSPLEKEFRQQVPKYLAQINEKIRLAISALDEAVALSEQYGIPFYSTISFLDQSYVPKSLFTLHPEVSLDKVRDITGADKENMDFSGWAHSQIGC